MVPIVVVGNKCELEFKDVRREIAETIALYDWQCGFVECSAKENYNIVQVFKELLAQAKVSSLKYVRYAAMFHRRFYLVAM
jgi:Translation initiation factor 2 (IF-2; GTPase)